MKQQFEDLIDKGVNAKPILNLNGNKLFYISSFKNFESRILYIHTSDTNNECKHISTNFKTLSISKINHLYFKSRHNKKAIIYIQGPHRRFVNGRQNLFFHHAITSILFKLTKVGYSLSCLNYKSSPRFDLKDNNMSEDWVTKYLTIIEEEYDRLFTKGCEQICLVGGSLGAVPLLQFLAYKKLNSAILFSPVTKTSIPMLQNWAHLFGKGFDSRIIAHKITTPLITFQGLKDNISPSLDVSDLMISLSNAPYKKYITFVNEGHIFQDPNTWAEVSKNITDFLI